MESNRNEHKLEHKLTPVHKLLRKHKLIVIDQRGRFKVVRFTPYDDVSEASNAFE